VDGDDDPQLQLEGAGVDLTFDQSMALEKAKKETAEAQAKGSSARLFVFVINVHIVVFPKNSLSFTIHSELSHFFFSTVSLTAGSNSSIFHSSLSITAEKRGRDATDDDPQNKRQSMGHSFVLFRARRPLPISNLVVRYNSDYEREEFVLRHPDPGSQEYFNDQIQ
jgi:hypothetical protein